MSYAIILGTRPEIIKMSPIIREYEQKGMDYLFAPTEKAREILPGEGILRFRN